MQAEIFHVLMSRDGRADKKHPALRDVPATLLAAPHVGDEVRIYLDDGNWMVTTPVKHVTRTPEQIRIETANSTYRMTITEQRFVA